MLRRFCIALIATALFAASCGRQVTPNRGGGGGGGGPGLQSGFMSVKFRIQQSFDFANVRYVVVFNTSGNGQTPYANGALTNYQNYSFAFVVGGTGSQAVTPALYEYVRPPNTSVPPQIVPIYYTPQQVIFIPNSNGLGTEFTIIFDRALFYGVPVTPAPGSSASPSPVPSTGGGSVAPQPTTSAQALWTFNFFTTDPSGNPYDALGVNGAQDTSFQSPQLDTTQVFDQTFYVPAGAIAPPNPPTEQITGGEIANNP